jgi:hypothetical protein
LCLAVERYAESPSVVRDNGMTEFPDSGIPGVAMIMREVKSSACRLNNRLRGRHVGVPDVQADNVESSIFYILASRVPLGERIRLDAVQGASRFDKEEIRSRRE